MASSGKWGIFGFGARQTPGPYLYSVHEVKLLRETGFDLANSLDASAWGFVTEQFQKRHLLAHRLGIIDADYVSKTGCAPSLLGRKVTITDGDVRTLVTRL